MVPRGAGRGYVPGAGRPVVGIVDIVCDRFRDNEEARAAHLYGRTGAPAP